MSEHDLARLIALLEAKLGSEWRVITEWLRGQNDLGDIEDRIRRGDFGGAVGQVEQAALRMASAITASYIEAGQTAARALDANAALADRLVRFDQTNQQALEASRRNQLEFVRGFVDEHRQVAQQITQRALIEGAERGTNPRAIARDFRDAIGLTPYQENVVANYRRELERGDWSAATGRELRDGRADRTMERLQRDGGRLPPEKIDSLVERYREGWVDFRAETIARTEALRNANEGSAELFRQAIDRGDIEADQLVVEWHAGPRTTDARPEHQAVDGTTVRYGEDFVLSDGTRMAYPGDPRGGAKHNANCRCTCSRTIAL